VRARFVVWEGANVLRVPTSALFRADEGWAAFVVENGRAVRRDVTIGHQAGLLTEVVYGLEEGEVVIVHPGNRLQDGTGVTATADS
jgi:HlyD family secretion protein